MLSHFSQHSALSLAVVAALALAVVLLLRNVPNLDLTAAAAAAGDGPIQPGDLRTGSPRDVGSAPPAPSPPANNPPGPSQRPPGANPGVPSYPAPGQGQPRAPVATPAPGTPAPAPDHQGSPRGPNPNQPQPAAVPQPPQGQWSLRSQLAQLGWDASQFADDSSAWNALATRIAEQARQQQQLSELARYGQYFVANQKQIQEAMQAYQRQQGGQPGAQPQQPAEPKLWDAPDWNPEWEKYLQFDQQGNPIVPLGMDPSITTKYIAWRDWQKNKFNDILRDPEKALGPIIEKLAAKKAAEITQRQVAGYDDVRFANNYVQSQPWVWERDQAGNVQHDMMGRPVLTPAGQMFQSYVAFLDQAGIKSVQAQQRLAEQLLRSDVLAFQLRQMQAGQGGGQQPQLDAQGNPLAPGGGQQQPGQQQPGQGGTNQQQKNDALNLNGARRIAGSGAQGANPPPSDHLPRRPIGKTALVNRITTALNHANVQIS
jgi:hypothetical protein